MKILPATIAFSILTLLCVALASAYVEAISCNTDYCEGKMYAKGISSADECITANDPSFNLPDVSDEFLRGCRKAFE